MKQLSMVMPMAGRGSRFFSAGFELPKPLIPLFGRPLFWWATESLRRQVSLRQMIFVVLEEHCRIFALDDVVLSYYPEAVVVKIPGVTSGAAESAMAGVSRLVADGPLAVNDCDHAFEAGDLSSLVGHLNGRSNTGIHGALLCFSSHDPAYSYAELQNCAGDGHRVVRTVEKKVISPYAIGGCYFLSSSAELEAVYLDYSRYCPYDELFMSGMFNLMIQRRRGVGVMHTQMHRSFGTPDELQSMTPGRFAPLLGWV